MSVQSKRALAFFALAVARLVAWFCVEFAVLWGSKSNWHPVLIGTGAVAVPVLAGLISWIGVRRAAKDEDETFEADVDDISSWRGVAL